MAVSKYLVKQIKTIMADEHLTWEQKHHKIFYDGLKAAIIEKVGPSVGGTYQDITSSNETECEHFYEWVMANVV